MIEVFFATNRDILDEGPPPKFGNSFNVHGPHWLRFGAAEVARRNGKYAVQRIRLVPEKIETKEEKKKESKLGSNEIFEALRAGMRSNNIDVICLIHGYASDIETALERAAELKDKYRVQNREPHAFVFSWPSDGAMAPFISYYNDRDDARASGLAIARAFLKLRDFLMDLKKEQRCEQSIHLVAHSMGNYALRHAVQAIRGEIGGDLPRLLDNIFLMAADVDDDAFEHDYKFRLLPQLATAVHVYFSRGDRALFISDATKRNPDRLGSQGPRLRDNLPRKVVLVDCRDVDESPGDTTNHQYYRLRPEVVEDVNHILAGLAPEDIPTRDYVREDRSFRIRPKKRPGGRAKSRVPGRVPFGVE